MKLGRLAFFALVAVAACDHRPEDFSKARADTATFQSTWQTRVDALNSRQSALIARVQAIPAGTAGRDDVATALDATKAQIDAMPASVTAATDEASAKINARHQKLGVDALSAADVDLRGRLNSISTALDAAATKLDGVTAAANVRPAAPPPPPLPTAVGSLTDPAFAHTSAVADIPGLEFQPGTAAFDLTKPAVRAGLDAVVAFAATCPELRIALVGHTAKDGAVDVNQRLSQAQAEAVDKYLVVSNVDTQKITQVIGVGGTQPIVDEPEAGSPEEAAMATDQLAKIRGQNRRVSVAVLTPCP